MQDNHLLKVKGEKIFAHEIGANMLSFFCSIIKPHIDCYWASIVFIISISQRQECQYITNSMGKFYHNVQIYMKSLYES